MGKNDNMYASEERKMYDKPPVNPVWRGIGFLFMILIPVAGYAGALLLIEENAKQHWIPVPRDILLRPGDFLYRLIPDPQFYIKAMLTIFIILVLFAIFVLITTLLSGMGGRSRYGAYDVPPISPPKGVRMKKSR